MTSAPRNETRPIVVSLYSGQEYYRAAADCLREDCERLEVDFDIVELRDRNCSDWISVCRRKVPFFLEMHRKHGRPILWLDIDSRLAGWPACLDSPGCDVAGFLRGLRYLRDFDPVSLPRFFAPFALYFNVTPAATAFLETMTRLEEEFRGTATDDYFLEEAWRAHEQQLVVTVLPPELVAREWPLGPHQAIHVGISGNVSAHKDKAQQHTAALLDPGRRRAMLLQEAAIARKSGEIDDALMLYRRALAAGPPDAALAERITRLSRQHMAASQADDRASVQAIDSPAEPKSNRPARHRWLSRS